MAGNESGFPYDLVFSVPIVTGKAFWISDR
jgi:hypothetical protein